MKTIIQKIWVFIAILWISAPMFAYDFTYDGLRYKWIVGDHVRLYGISKLPADGKLVVPEKVYDSGELQYVNGISDMRNGKNLYLLKNLVLNDNIDYIEPFALVDCDNLIRLEYNIRSCGFFATLQTTNDDSPFPNTLSEVEIGENVEYIPKAFISRNISVRNIKIPNSVTTIGNFAFMCCTNLNTVEIGEKVNYIGGKCFAGSSNLQSITSSAATPPQLFHENVFDQSTYADCNLFVPAESISLYKEATGWKNFYHIYSIGETPVENIALNPADINLLIGEQVKLTATIEPASSTIANITWSSDNETVATVGLDGTVTAVAVGKATITATAASGVTATCAVTVVETPAASITLNKTEATLKATETLDLIATVAPATTTDKSVQWKSSDEAVAIVNANGKVTAVAVGNATITATAASGVTATCAITVVATPAASITLNKTEATLKATETLDLVATVAPATTTDKTVTWTSSDSNIATVDANGKVTAIAVGNATITATAASGVTATCTITVVATPAASITLNKTEATLKATETLDLVATVAPATTTDKTVTWKSSDEAVATVDANGTVTAVAVGNATITATGASGVTATCAITVVATPAASITLNKTEATLKATETIDLVATVAPTTTTDKTVTWKSSDEAVATVDANGKVTAVAVGNATITATAASGVTATCAVTVVTTPAASITLNETTATLKATETLDLVATVAPATTTDKSVTWISSDSNIATVDANGKVTAVAVGNATITATAASGVTATCAITVVATPAASVTLNETEATLKATETIDLVATVAPATTTDKSVQWKSSDEAVATVDANGKVTAIAVGNATITATAASGVTATCAITVVATPAASITLNKTEATLKATETLDLVATVAPATTTDKSVQWKSSDEAVATVDANGKVTAIAVGNATITATAASGVTATCTITVVATPAASITLNKTAATLKATETLDLVATVAPATTTDKTVTWSTSNSNIATVDANSKVTAVAVGNATITATAASGVTATCAITVVETPVASLTINSSAVTMKVSEYIDLEATALPSTATDKTVVWSSSDATIAKVDTDGRVTAMSEGTAVVTATAKSGVTASCTVTVLPLELTLDIATSTTKVREGSPIEYYAEATGDTEGWTYEWSLGAEILSGDLSFTTSLPMGAGNDQATENVVVKLTASYIGDHGEQWAMVEEDAPAVTVYRRPMTPAQLLRKGDGASKTLIIMMGLNDKELAQRGYRYVYGYTDPAGDDHIVAATDKRYCRLDARIYDDGTMRKWCYAEWEYSDGSVVTSGKRYLDGTADEDFDASTFAGGSRPARVNFADPSKWISSDGSSVSINIDSDSDSEANVDVYTVGGSLIRHETLPAAVFGSIKLDTSTMAPGFYIISVVAGSERVTAKVEIK